MSRLVYRIVGRYQGLKAEVIDEFETRAEAQINLREYKVAYGSEWQLWIQRANEESNEPEI